MSSAARKLIATTASGGDASLRCEAGRNGDSCSRASPEGLLEVSGKRVLFPPIVLVSKEDEPAAAATALSA